MKYFASALVAGYVAAKKFTEIGYIAPKAEHVWYHVETELKQIPKEDLPKNWDWGNVNGINYLTQMRQQHLPNWCGSCWAHAATSALSDRIKIARKAAWPDINIAPQVLVSCEQKDEGCNGGSALNSYQFIYENYITDETCSIYQGRGWTNGLGCSPMSFCRDCSPGQACFIPEKYRTYTVSEFGRIDGELAVMNELYQRGPVACNIATPEPFHEYTDGIFCDETGDQQTTHVVSIVGWGEEDGRPYWRVRNSWGTHWGDNGFFKVCRGNNNINIETNCIWGVPVDTWTHPEEHMHHTTQEEQDDPRNDKTVYEFPQPEFYDDNSAGFLQVKPLGRVPKATFTNGEKNKSGASWDAVGDLPKIVDWRNMDGRNYLGWSKNQHVPRYCGSCWAHAVTSALADRFNIKEGLKNDTPYDFSPQVLVNCMMGGSCDGGDPAAAYEWAYNTGFVHSSCEQYTATNLIDRQCHTIDVCRDCVPPAPAPGEDALENCTSVPAIKYYVSDYYHVRGVDQMKADLVVHGPISCGIMATPSFHKYQGGIYSEVLGDDA